MYKRILLPTDGSDLALAAARHGLKLAKATGASVLGLYASPPFETPAGFEFVPAPLLPVDVYEKSAKQAAAKYLGEIEQAADKAERMEWEQQPVNIKINYPLAKQHFELKVKAHDTYRDGR